MNIRSGVCCDLQCMDLRSKIETIFREIQQPLLCEQFYKKKPAGTKFINVEV